MRTRFLALSILTIALALPASSVAEKTRKADKVKAKRTVNLPTVIWRAPQDITTRDLRHGPGGNAGQPRGRLRFVEEDKGGTNPKFVVTDERGARWKVKLGEEARSETAATRLLWAVGYFTDESYYLPRMRVAGLPRLSRGQEFVAADGTVRGARLERVEPGVKKIGDWSWFDNPFVGSKEFDGLRVMMALLNNWDLKNSNNGIYNVRGRELHYAVTDLGATFGKTGGNWTRSKNDVADYLDSKFIEELDPTTVDLVMNSRPPALYAVAVPYYVKRSQMEEITEKIPRAHARWIGGWLARLSDKQLGDAFRGAGYTPEQAVAYASKVRRRIAALRNL